MELIIRNITPATVDMNINEIEAELSRLNLKKDFIIEEIKKANEEISFKIIFENIISLLNAEFPEIVNQIRNKKEKIKETEEKYFDTTIRFEKAPFSFLKVLKELMDYYKLKFELKENTAL